MTPSEDFASRAVAAYMDAHPNDPAVIRLRAGLAELRALLDKDQDES